MARIYVSEERLKKLQRELEDAHAGLSGLRKEKNLAYTATGDTWHDNPYFNKLTQDEETLARKIAEIQQTISEAEIYNPSVRNIEQVRLGSIVRFARRYKNNSEETDETWEIVGFGETDVPQNRVAYNAPLGAALIGMGPGDTKQATTPKGAVEYEVIDLYPDWDAVPKK
ncbi:MAG TPA: GreA/GreB family elongation factor [Candidatus Paceibacterota bacterium]